MKYLLIPTLFFIAALPAFSQQPEDFIIEIEPLEIIGAPGIHSFSWGRTTDQKWVIIGGRIDGLHQRQPFAAFVEQDNNKNVFVIDPLTEQVWSKDLSSLPTALFEQIQSTNQQFTQRGNTLYITGGYGRSNLSNDHITFPNLLAISVDELANAVINNTSIDAYFRQMTDDRFKVTGGQMELLDSTFYLVGGQLFDGRYNPMGPNNGPGFIQVYSNEIRTFKLEDNGTTIAVTDYQVVHDSVNLHRRDYNMSPQIFPNGEVGFTAFSGVFDYLDMPYLNSVDIFGPTNYITNNSFNQYLSQYHSAKLPIYDTTANVMHNLFFGGLSQFTLDASGNLVEDIDVPFVKTISRVTRNANGTMEEVDLGYIEMPTLVGAGAEFIDIDEFYYENKILNLNAVPSTKTLVGYIYGGIQSAAPNIFFINDGSQSFASNVIFKVFINKSMTGFGQEIKLEGSNVVNLELHPNPVRNKLNLNFFAGAYGEMNIEIFDTGGRHILTETYDVFNIGTQEYKLNTSSLESGTYILRVGDGVISDQQKFIKK